MAIPNCSLLLLLRISVFATLSLWLAACDSRTADKQDNQNDKLPDIEVLKPAVEIRNEALARAVRDFPVTPLPYDTRRDSVMPAVSPLRDADLKILLRKGSAFQNAYPCYPMYRLPDYGNFVSLIFAALQQESSGLRLLLVTYSPEGKPTDELILKDNYDTGEEYGITETRIAENFALEQTFLRVFYEQSDEEDIKEKSRTQQTRRYTFSPEGKIRRQP